MSFTNEQKEATISEIPVTKKPSRQSRERKHKKQKWDYELNMDFNSLKESAEKDLVFDNENKENQEEEAFSQGRMLRKRGQINYAESDVETNSESDYVEEKSTKYEYELGKACHANNILEEKLKPSRCSEYHARGLWKRQKFNKSNNYPEVGSQFVKNLKDNDSEADSKNNLYVDGVNIRTSIEIWRQSIKYVSEINKQDLLYYNIIDTVETSATRARIIFKDKLVEMINTIESNINSEELQHEESQNVKKHIKEFMSKITTWTQLENVLENEKVKLLEKYEKQALELAKIFKNQFEDGWNNFTEKQTEYNFIINFVSQIFKLLFKDKSLKLDWGEKTLKASAVLKNELLQDDYRRSYGNKIDLVMSIVDIKLECMIMEVSGSPNEQDHTHYVGDRNKIAKMLKIIINYTITKYPGNFEVLRKIKFYGVQIYNHKFYVYSMCMPFSAIYYFKLEFKFECPITMRTLFRELPLFGQNLWKMKDLIQSSVTEIMKYIDSEKGEESDGKASVDLVN